VAEALLRLWHTFANAVGSFLDEAAFRSSLAWAVLRGKAPKPVEKRWWNRSLETPILIDVHDWTNERHIFSVLIWPALEVAPEEASRAQAARTREVLRVIHAGAAEMAWSTQYMVDYGLTWDHERQVWEASDGFAFDGAPFAGVGGVLS
jgi:hypothetical protein